MCRRPPRSTQSRSSAASDVYKRQVRDEGDGGEVGEGHPANVDLVGVGEGGGCDGCVGCLLYTSPSPRDRTRSRMPSSA